MQEALQATLSGPQRHPPLPRHRGRRSEESKRRQFFLALKVTIQSCLPTQPPSVLSEKTWLKGHPQPVTEPTEVTSNPIHLALTTAEMLDWATRAKLNTFKVWKI